MPKIIPMDPAVSFQEQLKDDIPERVYLVNIFHVPSNEIDEFVEKWTRSAEALQGRDGFVSTQLHRGIAGSQTFLNYAVWESVAAYKAAITAPEVEQVLVYRTEDTGAGTASPLLFRHVSGSSPTAV